MDDGQIACRPAHVDKFLRILDEEAVKDGAERAVGAESKSIARMIGSSEAKSIQGDDSMTAYVRSSTSQEASKQTHVLGLDFGDEFNPSRQFRELTLKVKELHDSLAQIEDTASELMLLR